MTMQNVIAFGTAIQSDKAMQDQLTQAIGGKKGQDAMAATADFASAKGYEVTTNEVAEGYAALAKADGGDTQELSDAEMEIVSGGKKSARDTGKAGGDAIYNGVMTGYNSTKNFFDGFFNG